MADIALIEVQDIHCIPSQVAIERIPSLLYLSYTIHKYLQSILLLLLLFVDIPLDPYQFLLQLLSPEQVSSLCIEYNFKPRSVITDVIDTMIFATHLSSKTILLRN